VTPKRYYTLMMEPELLAALKAAKEKTGLSEGAVIRLALRAWLRKEGVQVKKKTARRRSDTRKRA